MSTMDLDDLIQENPALKVLFSHRSIRRFKPNAEIPQRHKEIMERAAQRAATSCSGQMYSFIEISDLKIRSKLFQGTKEGSPVADAQLFYMVFGDLRRLDQLTREAGGTNQLGAVSGAIIAACDASLAAQNLVIAAEALGYGTLYLGTYASEDVAHVLSLPDRIMPLFGIAIGIPAEDPPLRPRVSKLLIYHVNDYKDPTKQQLEKNIKQMSETLDKEGYYNNYTDRENYTWRDHLVRKFGGDWMKKQEQEISEFITQRLRNNSDR